ncbi:pimeloyl-ACP methyl ester carboxylesterase [Kribbella steppae]|uniref:Pimeloyl-ACP methyl ester carboxylesterase n=1 Tax=Kribbella steppae TaxID=2512223 RepID=A0A4R2HF27_9ACTN|nr:alpha/beta hydrolase [Kribbella steppae]TCO26645.1 pimeloyl-ACP methyl ester carboxylesterase [Kribbella steppae]
MAGVGHFVSAEAQAVYLRLYDVTLMGIPGQRESVDVSTTYGQVRVYRYGADDGVPIVLLHGRAGTSVMWEQNIPGLAEKHPVYAIDVLGEPGRSVQTLPIRSSEEQAVWLNETLAELGLAKAHVSGVSGGAWLAFNLALHAPERIASLALVEPANVFARFDWRFLLGGFALVPGLPDGVGARYLQWVAGGVPIQQPAGRLVMAGLRDYRMKLPMPSYGTDDALRSVQVPTLALLGGRSVVHDPLKAAHRAQSFLPDNQTELWPEAGHGLPAEFPEQFNTRLLEFLGGQP